MKRIAFIGTRNLDFLEPVARQMFEDACAIAGKRGHVIRTGAAPGADQRSAEIALKHGCPLVELFLPWARYEEKWVREMEGMWGDRVQISVLPYNLADDQPALTSLALHPSSSGLSSGAQKLHARNYRIIAGNPAPPYNEVVLCDCVIAVPQPPERGGTGQGLRIARSLGIPVFNFSLEGDRKAFLPHFVNPSEIF